MCSTIDLVDCSLSCSVISGLVQASWWAQWLRVLCWEYHPCSTLGGPKPSWVENLQKQLLHKLVLSNVPINKQWTTSVPETGLYILCVAWKYVCCSLSPKNCFTITQLVQVLHLAYIVMQFYHTSLIVEANFCWCIIFWGYPTSYRRDGNPTPYVKGSYIVFMFHETGLQLGHALVLVFFSLDHWILKCFHRLTPSSVNSSLKQPTWKWKP